MSRKAIEILNAKIAQGKAYKGAFSVQAAVVQCAACHAAGKESDIQKSKMDCTPCHSGNPHLGDKFRKHPCPPKGGQKNHPAYYAGWFFCVCEDRSESDLGLSFRLISFPVPDWG